MQGPDYPLPGPFLRVVFATNSLEGQSSPRAKSRIGLACSRSGKATCPPWPTVLPCGATCAGVRVEPPEEQGDRRHAHAAYLLLRESLGFCQHPWNSHRPAGKQGILSDHSPPGTCPAPAEHRPGIPSQPYLHASVFPLILLKVIYYCWHFVYFVLGYIHT